MDPKFFYPSQSAVISTPPLKNGYLIAASTVIDEDPVITVHESNSAFNEVAASIDQPFGCTTLGLSRFSAPLVFSPPSQLEASFSDELESDATKQMCNDSEETSFSEFISLVAVKEDPIKCNFQGSIRAHVDHQRPN